MKLFIVGITAEDDPAARKPLRSVKGFINPTWAAKYAKDAGAYARFQVVEVPELVATMPQEIAEKLNEANNTKKD